MNYLSDPKVGSIDDSCIKSSNKQSAPIFLMTKEMRQDVRKPLSAKTNSTQARY